MEITISTLTTLAEKQLSDSRTPRLDAELLLCHTLKKPRDYLWTWPEQIIDNKSYESFQTLVTQRKKNIPVAYILGYKDFWTLRLQVNSDVLIPRPETEQLVELALVCSVPKNASVIDLGTGSGAIALALAHEKPSWKIFALDRNLATIKVAQQNAKYHNLSSVHFLLGDWCQPLKTKQFDIIISNPPYIKQSDEHLTQTGLQFEPQDALIAGKDGVKDLLCIISGSYQFLRPGGWLLIEHGFDQKDIVVSMFQQACFVSITAHQDLSYSDRIVIGQKPLTNKLT